MGRPKDHAEEKGLVFRRPFGRSRRPAPHGMAAWKVASGELTNLPMIRDDARREAVMPTGMSPIAEIDAAAAIVRDAGSPLAIFQCTT
jgi:N-acetylneuraminate synthase